MKGLASFNNIEEGIQQVMRIGWILAQEGKCTRTAHPLQQAQD
jgi:hypothetical protein